MTDHTRNLCKIEEIVTDCLQLKKVTDIVGRRNKSEMEVNRTWEWTFCSQNHKRLPGGLCSTKIF